jgi:hypothetical protein
MTMTTTTRIGEAMKILMTIHHTTISHRKEGRKRQL